MVFFICSHCGASLKKNKVEKHYALQCRNAPQVSCMDCHKEFRGNDYVAHTKCITEDEKYSAKGFVPKPNSNKGECKQHEWLEVVRGVQSQENLPKCLKTVLDSIVKFENVPRKKPKFLNFLKNNHIKIAPHDIDQLWDLLEKEHKRVKENVETSTTDKVAETKGEDSTADVGKDSHKQNGDLSVEIVEECKATPKDKTKKRKRKSKGEAIEITEKDADESVQAAEKQNETAMDIDQECEDTTKSKNKKKKNKTDTVDGSETQENGNLQAAEVLNENTSMEVKSEVTPKEKAKKKKNKKENRSEIMDDIESHASGNFQAPVKENETIPIEVSEESQITPKRKMKEEKKETGTEVVEGGEIQALEGKQEDVALTKKQKKEKKKREKYEAELKEIENSQFNDQPLEEDDDDGQNRKKKKSKKDKDVNGLDNNVNSVTGVHSEEVPIKPKKKRQLDDDQFAEPLKKKKKEQGDKQVEEICAVECVAAENSNGLQKFQWNEAILEVVRSKGGEIPVKRLRKKIVAEYQNCCCSAESGDKLTVKFNKKLPKVPGIIVHKDVVKLAE
ncbi:cell growth-regulating nucleolar protein [Schistocerca nitens]|uniref:cell growth-regulating nucleolar protein n=1 Tax=Schistocerca nitens TaxID=7011 RepID=UPI0021181888|nr:cell growth-regulating nucleolar protein [Schistocerca nitens]